MLIPALLARMGLASTPATVSTVERLVTSLCCLQPSLGAAGTRLLAAQAQPHVAAWQPAPHQHHRPLLHVQQDSSSSSNAQHGIIEAELGSCDSEAALGEEPWYTQHSRYQRWLHPVGAHVPPAHVPRTLHQHVPPAASPGAHVWQDAQPSSSSSPQTQHWQHTPEHTAAVPPAPASQHAAHSQEHVSREEQLFQAYLNAWAQHGTHQLPTDRQKLFELFKQQLMAELRAGEHGAERHMIRQLRREKFREGQSTVQRHMRPVAVEWMMRLQAALEDELVKAKSVLAHSAQAAEQSNPDSERRGLSPNQLTLWPLLASVGTEDLAIATVSGVLSALMNPYRSAWRSRGATGAGPVHAEDSWCTPSIHVAEVVGTRLEELVLLQHLREEVLSKQADARNVGPKRLAKMRHLTRSVEKRIIGQGTSLSHAARSALVASISHVEDKKPWGKPLKLQIAGEMLAKLVSLSHIRLPDGEVVQGLRQHLSLMPTRVGQVKQLGHIHMHEHLLTMLLRNNKKEMLGPNSPLLHDTRLYPMLIPPLPWSSYESGGLILHGPTAVRAARRHHMFAQADEQGQMALLYRGLNTLSALPWAVNTKVLDTMEALLAALPPNNPPQLGQQHRQSNTSTTNTSDTSSTSSTSTSTSNMTHSEPAHPTPTIVPPNLLSNLPTAWRAAATLDTTNSSSSSQRRPALRGSTPFLRATREGVGHGQLLFTAGPPTLSEVKAEKRQLRAEKQASSSKLTLMSELQLKLQVARRLTAHDCFYIPHNIDFRGRAYPTSCYLHQMGDDTSRGLLQFAEGKPLGPRGLDWLFIQLAKCFGNGKDKLPMEGRRAFGKENLPRILACAQAPLQPGEGQWWMEAEEPWQMLATCFEISGAITSGDPASYVSHLPLQQDGSCNGLQHYAALARDQGGAFAVNLIPSPVPQDVYTAVCKVVDARVRKDASEGVSEALKYLSRCGHVDRKLVKQTVMTSVYGVTHVGARQQIGSRLSERGWRNDDEVYTVSVYLAQATLSSIGELFSNAEEVMAWLAASASCMASTGKPVEWRSPLGFPICQPYMEVKGSTVESSLQAFWVQRPTLAVAKRSQRTAFPPNYIHSLDSAHMMMTAMACSAQGIAFAGVHDCFWTHAATADDMGAILRDKFMELHSRSLLEELVHEFKRQVPGIELPPIPPRGELDLGVVRCSPYFFS